MRLFMRRSSIFFLFQWCLDLSIWAHMPGYVRECMAFTVSEKQTIHIHIHEERPEFSAHSCTLAEEETRVLSASLGSKLG